MADAHIVYGFHAVTGRLRQDAAAIHEIYLDAARNDARAQDLTKLAASRGVRVMSVDALRLDGLTGHARHQGVAARVAAAPMKHDLHDIVESVSGDALLLVLDGVQDPHNLGACLRVADAFGVHAVIAPKDRGGWHDAGGRESCERGGRDCSLHNRNESCTDDARAEGNRHLDRRRG